MRFFRSTTQITQAALAVALGSADPALAKLYHPEYLHGHHGRALIDCARGFDPALRAYFGQFAVRDGLPATGEPVLTLASPKAPISRFTARVGAETYRGFVYIDPTLTPADSEPWEDDDEARASDVCSASFVDGHATAAERAALDAGWNETISRLYLDVKAHVRVVDLARGGSR